MTDCNTTTNAVSMTGARSNCVSDVGAFDMVGNVWEWVADALPRSQEEPGIQCGNPGMSWPASFGGDGQCLVGAATTGEPGALARGGEAFFASAHFFDGVFAATALNGPVTVGVEYGFRSAR
jgi:formylglycine-generating enzyme required for sulfatase activity